MSETVLMAGESKKKLKMCKTVLMEAESKKSKKLKMSETVLMEAESKKSKVNVFLHVLDESRAFSRVISTIFKLEMDGENPEKPSIIKPIFRFDCIDTFYPYGMSCVLLGSKLYLMGGSTTYKVSLLGLAHYGDTETGSEHDILNCAEQQLENYPPEVYVFDCNTCELLSETCISPMNSGKCVDPYTFVANGQIFVLSPKKGPVGMVTFETINPDEWKEWKKLQEPPELFSKHAYHRSTTFIKGKFLIIFPYNDHMCMLSYDIFSDQWSSEVYRYLPRIHRDSVFVHDTFYSVPQPIERVYDEFDPPVISFGPLDSSIDHDGVDVVDVVRNGLKKYSGRHKCTCVGVVNWPKYAKVYGYATRRLFHLGGILKGTNIKSRCFGFVEIFSPVHTDFLDTQCELRFVTFVADPQNSTDRAFHAETIHACHMLTDLVGPHIINAAWAYLA